MDRKPYSPWRDVAEGFSLPLRKPKGFRYILSWSLIFGIYHA